MLIWCILLNGESKHMHCSGSSRHFSHTHYHFDSSNNRLLLSTNIAVLSHVYTYELRKEFCMIRVKTVSPDNNGNMSTDL